MSHLTGKTVAFLATNGFEDSELTSPWEEIASHGATVELISTKAGSITGKNGHEVHVDVTTDQAVPSRYDGLVLPGGVVNSDSIRLDDNAVSFVKQIVEAGTPVGVICHGAWILADADVLRGRTITSFPTLKTDLRNAGQPGLTTRLSRTTDWCHRAPLMTFLRSTTRSSKRSQRVPTEIRP